MGNEVNAINFSIPSEGFDILFEILGVQVHGFLDVNFDEKDDLIISTIRRNDGDDKYNPDTPETLSPSGLYAVDLNTNSLIQLPGLYYDPRVIRIFDLDKNGHKDLVIFDNGDESSTHSYPVENNNPQLLDIPSAGFLTTELLFAEDSITKTDLLDSAIYDFRKQDEQLYESRIQVLSPYFQDDPTGIPDDVWKFVRGYNSVIFDFNQDGWDDIFVENGSSGIGPSQFIFDGKTRAIDPTFYDVWYTERTELTGQNQRFISYSVSASKAGTIWIAGGMMREDEPYMVNWLNILMEMEHTSEGWKVNRKFSLPLADWADGFTQTAQISIESDQNGDPKYLYLAHHNDQTNLNGRFVGLYMQALELDLPAGEVNDITSSVFPHQTKNSALEKADGSLNITGPGPSQNQEIRDLDLNNDGFIDIVFTGRSVSEYSPIVWMNTGTGKFIPATDLYLNSDLIYMVPGHISDQDSDGLIEFWSVFTQPSSKTFRLQKIEITDFRIDSIFGTLPVEQHLSGFNGAYLLSVLDIDPSTINRDNYASIFDTVTSKIDESFHIFAAGATVHGFENIDDIINLREGNEKAFGYSGHDHITGNSGNDFIVGGAGIDSVYFSGPRNDYTTTTDGTEIEVTDLQFDRDGKDSLIEIERLIFEDSGLAFDLNGNAGFVAKLLGAFLGASGIDNTEFVGEGLRLIDSGKSETTILQLALKVVFGDAPSGSDLVVGFYENLTGESPPESLLNEYSALIDSGNLTPLNLAIQVLEHEMNITNIDLVGVASSGLEYI